MFDEATNVNVVILHYFKARLIHPWNTASVSNINRDNYCFCGKTEVNFTCLLSVLSLFCFIFLKRGGLGEWKQYYEVGYTGLMINGEGEGR